MHIVAMKHITRTLRGLTQFRKISNSLHGHVEEKMIAIILISFCLEYLQALHGETNNFFAGFASTQDIDNQRKKCSKVQRKAQYIEIHHIIPALRENLPTRIT